MKCYVNIIGYTITNDKNDIYLVSKKNDVYSPILIDPTNLDINIECLSIFELPVGYILPRIYNYYFDKEKDTVYINYIVKIPFLWKKEGFYWVRLKDNTDNKLLNSISSYD